MKVAICPPLHELSPLWSNVFLWHLQLLGKDTILAMLSTKHANMFLNGTNVYVGFHEVKYLKAT
jgi:hypothetical protein